MKSSSRASGSVWISGEEPKNLHSNNLSGDSNIGAPEIIDLEMLGYGKD